MTRYVVARLMQTVVLVFLVTVATFALISFAPGGPAILYESGMGKAEMDEMRRILGLDQPVHVQYVRWLGNVLRGDLGMSLTLTRPVASLIRDRLPATILLSGTALLFAVGVGLPLGIIAGLKRNSPLDHGLTLISFLGISMPSFWYGLMLIIIVAATWKLLPAGGMTTPGVSSAQDVVRHLIMPALVLGTIYTVEIVRYTRSSMITVLRQDYVRTARAKGLGERLILFRHVLRNAALPIVTILGLLLPRLAAGAAVTEQVFAWPGMGQLAVRAAFQRDFPTIMGVTMVVSVVVVLASLLTDILYAYLDPRIRF
jgi:peptide/nickel transport system permease protein